MASDEPTEPTEPTDLDDLAHYASQGGRLRVGIVRSEQPGRPPVLTAYCPLEDKVVSLDECASCGNCDGLHLDPTGRDSFLMCSGPVRRERARADERRKRHEQAGNADLVRVDQIMTQNVVTASPELSLGAAVTMMIEGGVGCLPVVGAEGALVGLLSKTDLARQRAESESSHRALVPSSDGSFHFELGEGFRADLIANSTVADLMAPIVFTVPPSASVAEAAALMAFEGVHHVPVVDGDELAGILSTLDVLRWIAETHGLLPSSL